MQHYEVTFMQGGGQVLAETKVGPIEIATVAEDHEGAFLRVVRELNEMDLTGRAVAVGAAPHIEGFMRLTRGE